MWQTRRDGHGVIALFPCDPWDSDGLMCSSYEHVGQHGGADPAGVIARTRATTEAEYAALRRELEAPPFGYQLMVIRRTPKNAAELRRKALRRD